MSEAPLSRWVDPFALAARAARVHGRVPVNGLPRLLSAVAAVSSDARAELSFLRLPEGPVRVRGRIEAKVRVECQRCLQEMDSELVSEFVLAPVQDAFERIVGEDAEPVVLEDGRLDVWAMVDEELLLALPVAPRHPDGQCSSRVEREFTAEELRAADTGEGNPFKALLGLKTPGEDGS